MSRTKILCGGSAAAALILTLAVVPRAQTVDERVFFTFSGPVELPGVALPAGKYIFHLPDPQTHNVVQVLSADGKKAYGMFFTMPDERLEPADTPEVRFMETPAGTPEAIRAYWIAGARTGREFIYPREQAMRLARNTADPVLTTEARTTKTGETNTTALERMSASGTETRIAANNKPAATTPKGTRLQGEVAPATIAIAAAKAPAQSQRSAARTSLPKTASDLPLVGLSGLVLLGLAAVIRLWRRTAHV